MSNTGVFAPPHGVVFAPHLGGGVLKKNFSATRTYPPDPPTFILHPPTFQILEISLVLLWGLDLIPEMWYGEIAEGSNDNQSTTAKSSCVAESDPRSNLEMLNHLECHVE